MNVIREIQKINERELSRDITDKASWHAQYKDSAYVYVGGLPFEASEGDIITIFAQYGEVVDINLIRDKKTGKSKGYCFLAYEDQRSTILAVDNLNGIKIVGRTIRVDHVANYRGQKIKDEEDAQRLAEEAREKAKAILPDRLKSEDMLEENDNGDDKDTEWERKMQEKLDAKLEKLDPDDPMRQHYIDKHERKVAKKRAKMLRKEIESEMKGGSKSSSGKKRKRDTERGRKERSRRSKESESDSSDQSEDNRLRHSRSLRDSDKESDSREPRSRRREHERSERRSSRRNSRTSSPEADTRKRRHHDSDDYEHGERERRDKPHRANRR
ncbi:hypothetical protein BJ742DRAFT_772428 [Cladochytrium replicatum]|nr:hypothetical protein BJ742DRAFT_772428 [Cladochytrium replicatum]